MVHFTHSAHHYGARIQCRGHRFRTSPLWHNDLHTGNGLARLVLYLNHEFHALVNTGAKPLVTNTASSHQE